MLPKPRLVQGPRYGGAKQANVKEVEETPSDVKHEQGAHPRSRIPEHRGQRHKDVVRPLFPSFEAPRDRSPSPVDVETVVWTTQTGLFRLTGKSEVFAKAVIRFSFLQPAHAPLCAMLIQALRYCREATIHLVVVRAGQVPERTSARFLEVQIPELQDRTFVLPNAFTGFYRSYTGGIARN